jgi:SAM-dependent methyltransferase
VRQHARGELLDVGCGSKPFAPLFAGRVRRYWGSDLRASRYLGQARPDAFATAEAQPFRSGTFDTVLGLSMLTYLPEPGRMLAEAHRVLRPGGMLILEFTQMVPLHDEPHDYFRFTRYGAEFLLQQAGFEMVEAVPVGGLWARVSHHDRRAQPDQSRSDAHPHRAARASAVHRAPVRVRAARPPVLRSPRGAGAHRGRSAARLSRIG